MDGGVIRQQKNTILKDVSVEIKSGEFVYIIGKVGSGKSSFLKTLYAELPLEYGNAEVAGFQLKKIKKSQIPLLRRKCGIVFQDFKLLTDRSVYANLEFVLRATGWNSKKEIRERIDNVLTKVEMPDKRDKMPHQLSGGEQQRIVLARALLNAPPIILADEPTGNIDPETSYRLVELLKEICENGKTVIIATHQYDLIQKYPGRVFRCENGTLFEDPYLSVNSKQEMTVSETTVTSVEEEEITSLNDEEDQPKEEITEEVVPESGDIDIQQPIVSLEQELVFAEIEEEFLVNEEIRTEEVVVTAEQEVAEENPEPENGEVDVKEKIQEDSTQEPEKKDQDKSEPPVFGFELIN